MQLETSTAQAVKFNMRYVFGPAAAALFGTLLTLMPVGASATLIVDTLGTATPATTFSVFGSSGQSISIGQFVGPEFTLSSPTSLSEIGAFVNNCMTILFGEPQCPNTKPLVVQIRRSIGGVPDAFNVLASFELSHDNNPLLVSFESVAVHLTLDPGSYFALFAPQQATDVGFLLGQATNPGAYLANSVPLGFFDSTSGQSSSSRSPLRAAVRISAASVSEPPTLLLLAFGVAGGAV
jgi:hypothetical protein